MTYLGKFALGYFPYYFMTWDNMGTFVTLFGLGVIQVACFYAFAFANNKLKTRYLDQLAQKENIMNLDRGMYNEVQMNMFKSTINSGDINHNRRYSSHRQL